MPLYRPNREKFRIDVRDANAALARAQDFLNQGHYLEVLDIYEQLAAAHPDFACQILNEVHKLYQVIPNKDIRYNLYQARHFNFDIRPGEKVLDVGSGHLPFPFATHLSDISFTDNKYGRAGAPFKYQEGKPVYECNIESMPFENKEFDFVYCSHVLEHVHNPEKACQELMRVGKRGYIETPARAKDLFLNTARVSNHIWSVENIHDKLVFTQYMEHEVDGFQCDILMDMHVNPQTDRERAFSALVILKSDLVNTMVMWEGDFKYEVRRL